MNIKCSIFKYNFWFLSVKCLEFENFFLNRFASVLHCCIAEFICLVGITTEANSNYSNSVNDSPHDVASKKKTRYVSTISE